MIDLIEISPGNWDRKKPESRWREWLGTIGLHFAVLSTMGSASIFGYVLWTKLVS